MASPNLDLTSVRLVGVENSEMAFRYFRQRQTVLFVISNPANSTSSMANLNFSEFRVMLFRLHMSSH